MGAMQGLGSWGAGKSYGRSGEGSERREARASETSHIRETAPVRWGRGGPGGRGPGARGACGAHLGLLLREAGLGRDEAQRGGVRVLVDLVEVVLQNFNLVLGGAARCLRRHGPGGAAEKEKQLR